MKSITFRFFGLVAALLAVLASARGQVTVTFTPSTRSAQPGDVVVFQGTLHNSGATDVYLNEENIPVTLRGSSILPVAFDLHLNDVPFADNAPTKLAPGADWTGNLFEITIGIDAPATTYDGTFTVLGGASLAPLDPVGSGDFHLTVLGPALLAGPAAPTSLTTSATGSSITVSWTDNANNEEGFSVEQSTDGSNYTVIGIVGADRTFYTTGPLDPAMIYFFRVRAFNGFNTLTYSAYSNVGLGRTSQPTETLIAWNEAGWAYMSPMGGSSGTLPNRQDGTADPNFLTTWYLPQSQFATQYDGPQFGASQAITGTPGNSTTYDSGVGPGPLGYDIMDYWSTSGAEFTHNGTVLTTPTSLQRWTAYFRRTFAVPATGVIKPTIRYLMDDGGYIYLDGVLVATVNINAGVADTFTAFTATTGNEASLQTFDLSGSVGPVGGTNARIIVSVPSLAAGTHTLAISVHQVATSSSDLGLALELTGQPGQTVFAVASDSSAQVATADGGSIILGRTGDTTSALNVNFSMASGPGQAARGTRYALVPDSLTATIPAGQSSTTVLVNPLADPAVLGTQAVTLNLAAGVAYDVGTPSSAIVQLLDAPFNVWKIQQFGSVAAAQGPDAADNASPSGDGIANLVKYGLGLQPLIPAVDGLPVVGVEDFAGSTHLTLTVTRPHPAPGDVTYYFEYLQDLGLGNWNPAELVPGYPIVNGQTETIKMRDPDPSAGKTEDFIRLRVTRP